MKDKHCNVHFQLSALIPAMLQSKGIIALLPSVAPPSSLNPYPLPFLVPVPLPTPSPHPNPLRVRLAPCRLEETKDWADGVFGSRLILVSRLYLFSFLLPLYSASTSTAWLVILNRPPDLYTEVSRFRVSFGKCWS